jgi:hypothetical protein
MRRRPEVTDLVLEGRDVLALLESHLRRLRALPAHGNRTLHLDDLFVALLLAFYNPIVRSLRLIEDCGSMNGRLDLDRLARSTTSDALATFDPSVLLPVIADLRDRACALRGADASLAAITQRIIAADGTYLSTLADVAWALKHTRRDGHTQAQVRLNVQLDVSAWTPQVISVSGDDDCSGPRAFAPDLLEGVLYVLDRNFLDFAFLRTLQGKRCDFVLRIKANAPAMTCVAARLIDPPDAEAGVIGDELVTLIGRDAPAGTLRLVTLQTTDRAGMPQTIRLLSSLTAEQVTRRVTGEIYRLRWQIELFFKWLKTFAGMDHLLSTSRRGITFQFYVAVIAVLLMYVQLGRRVSRYALSALHQLMHGQITQEQMMRIIERREREKTLARARMARPKLQNQPR